MPPIETSNSVRQQSYSTNPAYSPLASRSGSSSSASSSGASSSHSASDSAASGLNAERGIFDQALDWAELTATGAESFFESAAKHMTNTLETVGDLRPGELRVSAEMLESFKGAAEFASGVGLAIDAYQIFTAEDRIVATFKAVGEGLGATYGAAGGYAACGGPVNPAAIACGVGGAVGGHYVGGGAGEWVGEQVSAGYDAVSEWIFGPEVDPRIADLEALSGEMQGLIDAQRSLNDRLNAFSASQQAYGDVLSGFEAQLDAMPPIQPPQDGLEWFE